MRRRIRKPVTNLAEKGNLDLVGFTLTLGIQGLAGARPSDAFSPGRRWELF